MGEGKEDVSSGLDLAEVRFAYDGYIGGKEKIDQTPLSSYLGIIILLFGLIIEALLLINYNPSSCDAVEVSSFFDCGSNGLMLIICTLFSLVFFSFSSNKKSAGKKRINKALLNLAKVSQFPSESVKLAEDRETTILSHAKSLIDEQWNLLISNWFSRDF